jgi:hypothetical protein
MYSKRVKGYQAIGYMIHDDTNYGQQQGKEYEYIPDRDNSSL